MYLRNVVHICQNQLPWSNGRVTGEVVGGNGIRPWLGQDRVYMVVGINFM
jgi:hypothetical protein